MKKISNFITLFLLSLVFGYTGFYWGGRERFVDIVVTKELAIEKKNEETIQSPTPSTTPKIKTPAPAPIQPKPTAKKILPPKTVPKAEPTPEIPVETPPAPTTQVS